MAFHVRKRYFNVGPMSFTIEPAFRQHLVQVLCRIDGYTIIATLTRDVKLVRIVVDLFIFKDEELATDCGSYTLILGGTPASRQHTQRTQNVSAILI